MSGRIMFLLLFTMILVLGFAAPPNPAPQGLSEDGNCRPNGPNGGQSVIASDWLSGWQVRKSHTIVGSSGAGINYQVRIVTHYGSGIDSGEDVYCNYRCQPDFNDIRFTEADGVTPLDHWRQSVALSSRAVFWVEIAASLDSSVDIYVYYGNATCASASSGSDTFPFFDDFDRADSSSVASGWTEDCFGAGYTDIYSNVLRICAEQHEYCHIEKPAPALNGFVLEGKIKGDANGGCSWAPGLTVYWNQNDWASVKSDTATARFYAEWVKEDAGNGGRAGIYVNNYWYWFRVRVDSTMVFMEYSVDGLIWNTVASTTRALTWSGAPSLCIIGKGYECSPSYPGSDLDTNAINGNVGTQYADNVFVRKHISSEPTHGAWGIQEPPNSGVSWLTEWTFRKLHNMTGSSGAGTNYQIRIVAHYGAGIDSVGDFFCDGHCQPDFDDIRFTDNDGVSILYCWIEEKVAYDYAVFWVRIADNLDSDVGVYVYYGNPKAESASIGDETFVFFDDFELGIFNPAKWEDPGDWQVLTANPKNGLYAAYCYAVAPHITLWCNLISKNLNYGFMLHVWARFGGLAGSAGYPELFRDSDGQQVYSVMVYDGQFCYAQGGSPISWPSNNAVSANTYYRMELGFDFQNAKQRCWQSGNYMGEISLKDSTGSSVTGITYYGPAGGYHSGEDVWLDDCYVRKWVPNEPQDNAWGAEESVHSVVATSNEELAALGFPGNGSEAYPYLISQYEIIANTSCVSLSNTTAHVTIERCLLRGALSEKSGIGIALYNVTNVDIEQCTISNWAIGVQLVHCSSCSIIGCWFTEDGTGVSSGNMSFECTVQGNHLEDCEYLGVELSNSQRFTITDNIFDLGAFLIEGDNQASWNHTVSNNTRTAKPIIFLLNEHDLIVDGESCGEVIIAMCDNVTLRNGLFEGSSCAVEIGFSTHSIIENVSAFSTRLFGLSLVGCLDCSILDCVVCGGFGDGIVVRGCSYLNIVSSTIYANLKHGIVIVNSSAMGSQGNTVSGNSIGKNAITNAMDNGSSNVWDDGISIGNRWHDYGGSGAYMIPGSAGAVDRFPSILAGIYPEVSHPADMEYELGSTGHSITWTTLGRFPDTYIIRKNGLAVMQDDWTAGVISFSVSGLGMGVYNYSIELRDIGGMTASDSVVVSVVDTTPPTIDHPQNISYDYRSVGHSLRWSPRDLCPSSYTAFRNGIPIANGTWAGTDIVLAIDGLSPGVYNYTLLVLDASSNRAFSIVFVHCVDAIAPTVVSLSDIEYEFGMTGQPIVWIAYDEFPVGYQVLQNGTPVESGAWDGRSVTYLVGTLAPGNYNFTLVLSDLDSTVADVVWVRVARSTPPVVNSPDDVTFDTGTTGNEIVWSASERWPSSCVLYLDGAVALNQTWDGGFIRVDIDSLSQGMHNLTLVLLDLAGNWAVDTVMVNVVDTIVPRVIGGPDILWEKGMSSPVSYIWWICYDANPGSYEILLDSSSVCSGTWNNTAAIWFRLPSYLTWGTHNITARVLDQDGHVATDTVMIIGYEPVMLNRSAESTFLYGTTGHEASWTLVSGHPDQYMITIDGIVIQDGSWESDTVSVSLDNLQPGNHTVSLAVLYAANEWFTDVFLVNVLPATHTTAVTGEPQSMTLLVASLSVMGAVAVCVLAAAVLRRKRMKGPGDTVLRLALHLKSNSSERQHSCREVFFN